MVNKFGARLLPAHHGSGNTATPRGITATKASGMREPPDASNQPLNFTTDGLPVQYNAHVSKKKR
jgi:hypothetical protein